MKVLSLFDGISCGRIALERAGFTIEKYYASEIDKYAIQVSQKNYPDNIHIGSVTGITYKNGAIFHNQDNDPMINGGSYITDIDILIG
jgi:site-specific DNA-cytosine methylase